MQAPESLFPPEKDAYVPGDADSTRAFRDDFFATQQALIKAGVLRFDELALTIRHSPEY